MLVEPLTHPAAFERMLLLPSESHMTASTDPNQSGASSGAASAAIPPRPKASTPSPDEIRQSILAQMEDVMKDHRAFMQSGGLPVPDDTPVEDPSLPKGFAKMSPQRQAAEKNKPQWFAGDAVAFDKAKTRFNETDFARSHGAGIKTIRVVTFGTVLTAAAIGAFSTVIPGANAVAYCVFLSSAIPFAAGFFKKAAMNRRMTAAVEDAAASARDFPSKLGELQQAVQISTKTSFEGRVARVLFADKLRDMRSKGEAVPLSARKVRQHSF